MSNRYKYLDFEAAFYNPDVCVVIFIDAINDIQYADYIDFNRKLNLWKNYIDSVFSRYSNIKIVVSSRHLEFLSNFEIRNYTRLFIEPLDDQQVSCFINQNIFSTEKRTRIQEFIKRNIDEMPFLRIPFYLKKVLSATIENFSNKTDVINMFIGSLFQKGNYFIRERRILCNDFGRQTADIRLNGSTFLDAMGKLAFDCQRRGTLEFDSKKIDSFVHQDSQHFLDVAINNSIFSKSGLKFEHTIFRENFSGRYIAKNLPYPFGIKDLIVFESEVHLCPALKHVYNFIDQKEAFVKTLLENNKFEIAAECVMENSDVHLTQLVADSIVNFIHGKNLLDSSNIPNLGAILGRLGDTRFSNNGSNIFEPPTKYIPRLKLNVGIYPITNREFSFFINDDGYHKREFWPAPANCWFDREQKIQSIICFWRDI